MNTKSMSSVNHENVETNEVLADDCVLIVGGGPVGLLTAAVLAFYGIPSVIIERNSNTTRWPKMDLTNVRSMEFFRKLGLADELRRQGIRPDTPYNVLFSTGLGSPTPVTAWNLPGVSRFRETINSKNDGSQPLEPYQRLSQEIFEAWMKRLCEANPLVDVRFGWKLDDINETADGVEGIVSKGDDSNTALHRLTSRYVVACDGASSRCRRTLNIPLDGGPVPISFLLIHFRSRDTPRLFKQGIFWHLFILKNGEFGGAVISQDAKEIFTIHYAIPPGTDPSAISSEEAIHTLLGGIGKPYEITIDEVLVRSTYRPSIAVARSFSGPKMRIFLAGDAAHQNVPTGGYGMNTGLGDAFDIGWKLAAVIRGWGHPGLLAAYEQERRPVAIRNVERSGVHMDVHMQAVQMLAGGKVFELERHGSEEGRRLRDSIREHYQNHDGENTDMGIEMGYRYRSGVILSPQDEEGGDTVEPPWDAHVYRPTTWPGSRPPHVFLSDGSAIFDRFGKHFTVMEFDLDNRSATFGQGSHLLVEAANKLAVPLRHVCLANEEHAARLWEKPLVLVRPDGHVAWRGNSVKDATIADKIIETAVGCHCPLPNPATIHDAGKTPAVFTMVGEDTRTQTREYTLENMGDFQR